MSGAGTPEGASEANRPGTVLRAEREALGVTVREVAETLNLSLATIEAIEADDHTRLPGPVFARG
jgi:cytoskeleton protein RodZ